MSMAALLRGVQARLRSSACLDDAAGKISSVRTDGRPPVNFGQWFYAIHMLQVQNTDPNSLSSDRSYAIGVTITARMANVPDDRRGGRIVLSGELIERAEQVADWLHQDDTTRAEANKLIPGTQEFVDAGGGGSVTTNGFEEPLRLGVIGPPVEMPGEWIGEETEGGEDASDEKNVLTILVSMADARRLRSL